MKKGRFFFHRTNKLPQRVSDRCVSRLVLCLLACNEKDVNLCLCKIHILPNNVSGTCHVDDADCLSHVTGLVRCFYHNIDIHKSTVAYRICFTAVVRMVYSQSIVR